MTKPKETVSWKFVVTLLLLLFATLLYALFMTKELRKQAGARRTQEEILTIAEERLEKFQTIYKETFMTCLPLDLSDFPDSITIRGVKGYFPVTGERFATLQSLTDYVASVCTQEFAQELISEPLLRENSDATPLVAEQDGKLYAQAYDGVYIPIRPEFCILRQDTQGDLIVCFTYEYETEEPSSMQRENGFMTLTKEGEEWKISHLSVY